VDSRYYKPAACRQTRLATSHYLAKPCATYNRALAFSLRFSGCPRWVGITGIVMKQFFNFSKVKRPLTGSGSGASVTDAAAAGVGERWIEARIGERTFRITSDDKYLDHIGGEFEPDMVKLFSALIRPGDLVLDVGANIGCTSILFGQHARQVLSFEPSPSTFLLLQKNLAAAGMCNVEAVNAGLGNSAGTFELTFAPDNRSGGFVSNLTRASAGHQVEEIRIVNGDRYLGDAGIGQVDFIKIDVEGFERNVIEGLRDTIERGKPVVVLELNHWCLNVFQRTSVPDFLDFLRGVFPILYAIEGTDARDLHDANDAYHVMYQHIVNNFRYPNLVGAFDRARLARILH
jgi:FkbM family methyltransferase